MLFPTALEISYTTVRKIFFYLKNLRGWSWGLIISTGRGYKIRKIRYEPATPFLSTYQSNCNRRIQSLLVQRIEETWKKEPLD